MCAYKFKELEEKWVNTWEKNEEYKFIENLDAKKLYILDMFPYPSGSGLHVGHLKGYLATDILTRYYKMKGYCVFHPMGWDAFGLPAEQYAIQTGNSPKEFTNKNINNFRKQLKRLGLSYDFSLEVNTSDPNYYKHTQWIFSQMYKHNLAELKSTKVNWCKNLNTVLADEEIIEKDGKKYSERGNHPVIEKSMKQWILKITEYAPELLKDLDNLEWPENIKKIQEEWIGANSCYEFKFTFGKHKYSIFLKYASSIRKLKGIGIHQFSKLFDLLDLNVLTLGNREVLPIKLINELNGEEISVCFLKNYLDKELDLIPIFEGGQEEDFFDQEIENFYKEKYKSISLGTRYKLRDWVFSRQRYWGEPIPILYENNKEIHLDENLPVILPDKVDYETKREAQSPLINNVEWINVTINNKKFKRESNTMPNWAGSSWYFIAYLLKKKDGTYHDLNSTEAKNILNRWMPVDIYIGGQEHATMHLLYARFWYKFLNKLGIVNTNEPFKTLFNQGLILGEDGTKMSKSKGNYVCIDEIVEKYGSDALRVYEAFSGPTQLSFKWEEEGIKGSKKWLNKVWIFFNELKKLSKVNDSDRDVCFIENKLIYNAEELIPNLKVNSGVSELMIFLNEINKIQKYSSKSLNTFTQILSLYAPALSEEIWNNILKNKGSVFKSKWPELNQIEQIHGFEYKLFINGKFKCVEIFSKMELDDEEYLKTLVSMKLSEIGLNISIFEMGVKHESKVIFIKTNSKE